MKIEGLNQRFPSRTLPIKVVPKRHETAKKWVTNGSDGALESWQGGCYESGMIHYTEKNRSPLCHLITDFRSPLEKRVARFDLWGVLTSVVLASLMVGVVRLFVAH